MSERHFPPLGSRNTDITLYPYAPPGSALPYIIPNFFINDAEQTPVQAGGLLREVSYAYVYFGGRLDVLRRRSGAAPDWQEYYTDLYRTEFLAAPAPGWQRTRDAISRLAKSTRSQSADMIIANYPDLHELDLYPFASITAALLAIAHKESVDFVDLFPSVAGEDPQSLWVHPLDAHPNAAANANFATMLMPVIMKQFGAD